MERMTATEYQAKYGKKKPKTRANRSGGGKRGEPNKTEAKFRDEWLIPKKLNGDVDQIYCEGLTFRMPSGNKYTPDWVTLGTTFLSCEFEINVYEVKKVGRRKSGSKWESGSHDSKVRAREAAYAFPGIIFWWCELEDGEWTVTNMSKR